MPPTARTARVRTTSTTTLVPLELGGATNDARNLWPEPDYTARDGFYNNPKDKLERALNRIVCNGAMSLCMRSCSARANGSPRTPTAKSAGAQRTGAAARMRRACGAPASERHGRRGTPLKASADNQVTRAFPMSGLPATLRLAPTRAIPKEES